MAKVEVTHPDKVLFPKEKITKEELVAYYRKVARRMLPHIQDRPISMKKFPKGIKETGFFQKNAPEGMPKWVKTTKVRRKESGKATMVLCNDTASLVWLANQNCITPHIELSTIKKPEYPDRMIFDLDPPAKKPFHTVVTAAFELRDILKKHKLKAYVTTTGSKGLHVVVPIVPTHKFDKVRAFAKVIAKELVEKDPKSYTLELRKDKRKGKIYIDVLRNGKGQTVMAPYAVRPLPGAPVATPLSWEELKAPSMRSGFFTIRTIGSHLKKNPWASMARNAKKLP